jgi:hypothetical protein
LPEWHFERGKMNVLVKVYGSFDLKRKKFRVAVLPHYDLHNLIALATFL